MTNTTKTETNTGIHIFERAGLGKAPFKYVGMIEQDLCYGEVILNRADFEKTGVRVTTKPGGSCDYCGAYIVNMFKIVSSDGKTFKVGSDCVHKTGDAGLKKIVDAKVREMNAKRAAARDAQKIDAARAGLAREDVRAALSAKPHPMTWRAEKGETMLTMAEWYMTNAGTKGKLGIAKVVAEAVAGLAVQAA